MATNVLLVRGHQTTPWELAPWGALPDRFDVSFLQTRSNGYDTSSLPLSARPVGALRDRFPKGPLGEVLTGVLGDRYTAGADAAYGAADIVHAEELSFWFAADAARRKQQHGYKLVQTVWETLPFLRAFRNRHAREFRDEVLAHTDLFLPATERARLALLLEGVPEDRVVVCPPGIDVSRFGGPAPAPPAPDDHTILSPGRLSWEKGHHDAMRAVALLHRGIVTRPDGSVVRPKLRIVGSGPEEERLRAYADELGIGAFVEIGSVPYAQMHEVFQTASVLLLGSTASSGAGYHPFDIPRVFWEEQFGMVFAEAMAAGLDIVTTTSGAIPEVLDGSGTLVAPGDWPEMARVLAAGPLSRPAGARVTYPAALLERYSLEGMAARLADAYDRVLAR